MSERTVRKLTGGKLNQRENVWHERMEEALWSAEIVCRDNIHRETIELDKKNNKRKSQDKFKSREHTNLEKMHTPERLFRSEQRIVIQFWLIYELSTQCRNPYQPKKLLLIYSLAIHGYSPITKWNTLWMRSTVYIIHCILYRLVIQTRIEDDDEK